jgi:hypothetical protein
MKPDDAAAMLASQSDMSDSGFGLQLLGVLAPIVLIVGLALYFRWRSTRLANRMAATTITKLDTAADELMQTAARQKQMIELLQEIRDRLPPAPQAPPGSASTPADGPPTEGSGPAGVYPRRADERTIRSH